MQTNTYKVYAGPSGIHYGTFHGPTEAAALDAYAELQGYSSFAALADTLELTLEQARCELHLLEVTIEEKAAIAQCFANALDGALPGKANEGLRAELRDAASRWVENEHVAATPTSLRVTIGLACRRLALQASGASGVEAALAVAERC